VQRDETTNADLAQEVARLREELARERARRTALADEHRDLVAVVCHELRTPITVITGFARLLLSDKFGDLNARQRHFVEECAKSCGRLDGFVELLLRGVREERAVEPYAIEDASLGALLRGALAYLAPVIEETRAEVALRIEPDAEWARFDAARIEQVVVNLVGNALRHAGDAGSLRIAVRSLAAAQPGEAQQVEVSVADDGPGIPPEERERIFEPFVRGRAVRGANGLGLGLSICRRIVERHGGRLALRPEPSGGACFTFTLPAALPKEA